MVARGYILVVVKVITILCRVGTHLLLMLKKTRQIIGEKEKLTQVDEGKRLWEITLYFLNYTNFYTNLS